MTTIAYKDGVIAYDSLCTQEQTIIDYNFDKRVVRDGVQFFFCGATSDYNSFVEAYFGGRLNQRPDCAALVVDKGIVYRCGVNDENVFWKCAVTSYTSIGSGQDHALTAMDMGADAKTAVKMAIKRDTGTGGRVRTFKI